MSTATKYLESRIQATLYSWFQLKYPKLAHLFVHIPNGVHTSVKTGARLKTMGLRKGFPDLGIFYPVKPYHGLFIELKTEKGFATSEQKDYLETLAEQGYKVCVTRGLDQAIKEIESYLAQ